MLNVVFEAGFAVFFEVLTGIGVLLGVIQADIQIEITY